MCQPIVPKKRSTSVINPYSLLGCPEPICWPRGYPLNNILDDQNVITTCGRRQANKFGVLQSLADHQPDVDAIFRMTKGTIFQFDKRKVN